jgi:hypothetical protein
MKSVIVIDHGELVTDRDEDHEILLQELEQAVAERLGVDENEAVGPVSVEGVSARLGFKRNDWEPGDKCVCCGSTLISVMEVEDSHYLSKDGEFRFQEKGEASGGELSYFCINCETLLAGPSGLR